jgi:hypothetical protein
MLTGTRAFEGREVPDVLARILEREPDFSALPPTTPVAIRRVLRRCLEKDGKRTPGYDRSCAGTLASARPTDTTADTRARP